MRGFRQRAGAWALSLLGTSPNSEILRAVAGGALSLGELRGEVDAPGSTLRARLRGLEQAGALASGQDGRPRGAVGYELTAAGADLLPVIDVLERWLAEAPGGERRLGGSGARTAIAALCEGWSATLLRPLAAKPLSVADLDQLIPRLSYPSLERRVAAMRLVGQVEARPAIGRETPYAVTGWLRRGVATLLAAIHWERDSLSGPAAVPAGRIDLETALLLALPLLRIDEDLSGICRLTIELPGQDNGDRRLAGALVELRGGTVAACGLQLGGVADAWVSGSLAAWLRGLIDGDHDGFECGGDSELARMTVAGLHRSLFLRAASPDNTLV